MTNGTGQIPDTMLHYANNLRVLTNGGQFPELSAVIASGVLDDEDMTDDDYSFGLERVLDGIGVLVRAREAG